MQTQLLSLLLDNSLLQNMRCCLKFTPDQKKMLYCFYQIADGAGPDPQNGEDIDPFQGTDGSIVQNDCILL